MTGRTVVTGGFGFIGRHVVERLLQSTKTDVVVLARPRAVTPPGVACIAADIRDPIVVRDAIQPNDVVIHLACLAVGPSRTNPADDFAVNAMGTFNVLEAARHARTGRVVIVSSAEVYGEPTTPSISEDHPLAPNSPYGASKASGDLYAGVYRTLYGVDAMVLRLFNVFGPAVGGVSRRTVETIFATNARAGLPLTMQSHPETSRDFVFVDDVVNAIVTCAAGRGSQAIYNIGSGVSTTLRELALAAGYPATDVPQDSRTSPVPVKADIGRARRDLGFRPTKSVLEYVEELRRSEPATAP